MKNPCTVIANAYNVLKANEGYWTLNSDYCTRYDMLKEVATSDKTYSRCTLEFAADLAETLMTAHNRIFG